MNYDCGVGDNVDNHVSDDASNVICDKLTNVNLGWPNLIWGFFFFDFYKINLINIV
jgi:hypothetical protein